MRHIEIMDSSEDSLLTRNQIPIIDLSHISIAAAAAASSSLSSCLTMKKIASQLEKCLAEKGMALLVNHGIPQHKLSAVYKEMESFRKCNRVDKDTFQSCSEEIIANNPHDYTSSPSYAHYAECYKEEYHLLDTHWLNEKLPENEGQQLRSAMLTLSEEFRRVSTIVLYALSMALGGVDAQYFVNVHTQAIENHSDNLKVLYSLRRERETDVPNYPKQQDDLNTFTLLAQDPDSNLELSLSENKWLRVGHLPGAILFHAGKHLENWTDGKYKFLKYRVMTPEETLLQLRSGYICMYQVQPSNPLLIDPILIHQLSQLPEVGNQEKNNQKRYMALFTAVQHIQRRLKLTKICKMVHLPTGTRY